MPLGFDFKNPFDKNTRESRRLEKKAEEEWKRSTALAKQRQVAECLDKLFFDQSESLDALAEDNRGDYEVMEYTMLYLATYKVDGERFWDYDAKLVDDLIGRGLVGMYNVQENTFLKEAKAQRQGAEVEVQVEATSYHGLPLRKKD